MMRLFSLAAGLSLFFCGTPKAQEHTHDDSAPDTAGWTSPAPGGAVTPADSLPAFRPDSLKDEAIRSVESRPSPFEGRASAGDSADSVAALLRGRRPALSIHLGLNFIDLDAMDVFSSALQTRMIRDSLTTLQPYEPVHLAFPIGLQATIPIGPWFDLVAKTHSYWYEQTAVIGRRGVTVGEESFAVQANLAGAGLRYYIPPGLLSVTGKLGLYFQGAYFWLLGNGEMYTTRGSAPAEFDPAGSAWELQLGFNRAMTRPWAVTGNLGFMQQSFTSKVPWTSLVQDNAPAGRVKWAAGALQASLNLAYNFGVKIKPSATGIPENSRPSPEVPAVAPDPGPSPAK